MATKKNTGLHNGDLSFDIEKIKGYDKPKVKKDAFENEEVTYTIEVNDESYFYADKKDRDEDFATLKKLLSGKIVLQIKTKEFVKFMTDDNGTDITEVAKKLIKKGSFTVEDLLSTCGYIPSNCISNKTKVPNELRLDESYGEFEVYPENFIILFV
jgi:hypothetical protein